MIPEFASPWELPVAKERMRRVYIDGKEYYMLVDSLKTNDSADVPTLPVQTGQNQGFKISDNIWPNPSTVNMSLVIYDDYRDEYVSHLKNIYKNKTPVQVITPWEVFPHAVIRELEISAKKKAINVLVADVTFQEVRMSKISVETIKSPKPEEVFTSSTVEVPVTGKLKLYPERPKFRWTQIDRTMVDPNSPLYEQSLWKQIVSSFTGHDYQDMDIYTFLEQGIELQEHTFTVQKVKTKQGFVFSSGGYTYNVTFQFTSWDLWYYVTHGFNFEEALYSYAMIEISRGDQIIFRNRCDVGTTYKLKDGNGYQIGLLKRTGQFEFKIWLPP